MAKNNLRKNNTKQLQQQGKRKEIQKPNWVEEIKKALIKIEQKK